MEFEGLKFLRKKCIYLVKILIFLLMYFLIYFVTFFFISNMIFKTPKN